MGWYDTYGDIQLKIGTPEYQHFKIGDIVQIDDGIYIAPDGFVVIYHGKFVAAFSKDALVDKWGEHVNIDIEIRSPVVRAMERAESKFQ